MANELMGMFTTPEEIAQAQRAQEEANLYKAFNSGNAFLQGQALGGQIAGGLGGMLGGYSPAEAKASELQAMMQSGAYDLNTSDGLANFAKDLNGLGYTKEALAILGKRNEVLDRETATADRERKLKQGQREERRETVMVPKLDSKGRPVILPNGQPVMEPKTAYYTVEWNDKLGKWERMDGKGSTSSSGADEELDLPEAWKEQMRKGKQPSKPSTATSYPVDIPNMSQQAQPATLSDQIPKDVRDQMYEMQKRNITPWG